MQDLASFFARFITNRITNWAFYEFFLLMYGDYLGKNEVRELNTSYVYVIGRKLLMHESSDLSSAPVQVLGEGTFVELLDSQQGVLYVRDIFLRFR